MAQRILKERRLHQSRLKLATVTQDTEDERVFKYIIVCIVYIRKPLEEISVHIKNVWHMSTILNNQIQPVSETRLSSLPLTSALSHWLRAKLFVFSLYKCVTTRMVGRPVNITAVHTTLLKQYPYSSSTISQRIPPVSLTISPHFISPCTEYFALIPHIPTQPTTSH